MDATAQAFADDLHHVLGVRNPQSRQKLAGEQRAFVEVADDWEIAAIGSPKAQIVAARTDMLAADNQCCGFRPAIAVVPVQRQVLALFDFGKAKSAEGCQKKLPIAEHECPDRSGSGSLFRRSLSRVRAGARRLRPVDRVQRQPPGDPAPSGGARRSLRA